MLKEGTTIALFQALKTNQNHAKLRVFHYYSFVADPAP
jgi:hypothetical protein